MDYPKAPDDARDWNSIDIYLFTNGQNYSPPRKYHLKTEELKLWGATLNILGCSQFGSLQSNIELYTLDGRKIDTPLELANDAAYVAVKPPESFIQTGYEKYLLKASRSWEKRHERLNGTEIVKSDREINELDKEQIKSNLNNDGTILNDEKYNIGDLPLDTKSEYIPKVENSFKQSHRDINTNHSVKPELLQRRKPESYTKNTILKKFYPNSKSKEDGNTVNKKRITSFPKNLMKSTYNSKRVPVSSNNSNILKTNLDQGKTKMKSKEEPQTNSDNNIIEKTKEKTENLKNDPVVQISPGPSDKYFTILSDVYKNTESDVQSVFLDADRKTALLNNEQTKIPPPLENIEEFKDTSENCPKTNKSNSQRSKSVISEIQTPCNVNQPGTIFNINLNIDLKGYTHTLFKSGDMLCESNKCKTYMTLMKPEKASQVNIDVNLSKEILNSGHEVLLREQSVESGIAKPCEEKFADNKTNVIVHCKCNLVKSDTPPIRNFNENDHYMIVIPAEQNDDKFTPRSDLESRRGSDKEIQELLHSCIRIPVSYNSEVVANKKLENDLKHKVSICQDAPKEFNFKSMKLLSERDIIQNTSTNDNTIELNYKIDNFAQTDWCNTLLQVKCNEDGRYTFHIPSLDQLTKYNLL